MLAGITIPPSRTMTPQERIEHVRFWLELKQAWDRWKAEQPMPPLSDAARAYFERMARLAVTRFVDSHPQLFLHTAPPASDVECWDILLEYLVRTRPVVRRALLDDVFATALRKATEKLAGELTGPAGLEQAVGWIINQFFTRVLREAMRDYVRQHAPPPHGTVIIGIDAPGGSVVIPPRQRRWWETEIEREEVEQLGKEVAASYFAIIRPAFRLSLATRSMRHSRAVIISCDDNRVLAVAGVGRAIFADGVRQSLEGLGAALEAQPALAELDPLAFSHARTTASAALTDAAEAWFFSGQWIDDCCREQKGSATRKGGALEDDFCARLHAHAKTLAALVRDRLREAGHILPENELALVFHRLAGPTECL